MKREAFARHVPRSSLFLIAGLLALLVVVSLPVVFAGESKASPVQAPHLQSSTGRSPALRVEPSMAVFPADRERDGVWFLGSGLEPGQGVHLLVPSGSFTYNLTWGQLDELLVVNDEGAFAASMEIRPRQADFLWTESNTILLKDADTGQVIASAALIFCFPTPEVEEGEEEIDPSPWCDAASPLLPR